MREGGSGRLVQVRDRSPHVSKLAHICQTPFQAGSHVNSTTRQETVLALNKNQLSLSLSLSLDDNVFIPSRVQTH
jgi:hypothetical protein